MRLLRRRRPKIEKLKRAGNVEGLRAALAYEDTYAAADGSLWDLGAPSRAEAAKALATFDDPEAVEALVGALDDPHPQVRAAVVDGIAGLEVPVDPEPLVDRLVKWRDPVDAEARESALTALTESRTEGMADLFLRKLLDPGAPEPEDQDHEAVNRLLAVDPRGEDAPKGLARELLRALAHPADDVDPARAEEILIWLGPAAADSLIDAFEKGVAHRGVIRAAGIIGDARALHPLVGILEGSDAELRASAASALSQINDTRAVSALMHATQDPELPVRAAASEALNSMGIAAVIAGVAGVIQEAWREQIEASKDTAAAIETEQKAIPERVEQQLAHPPIWAQEVLERLRKRRG